MEQPKEQSVNRLVIGFIEMSLSVVELRSTIQELIRRIFILEAENRELRARQAT